MIRKDPAAGIRGRCRHRPTMAFQSRHEIARYRDMNKM